MSCHVLLIAAVRETYKNEQQNKFHSTVRIHSLRSDPDPQASTIFMKTVNWESNSNYLDIAVNKPSLMPET